MNKAKNEKLYTITVNNTKFTNPSVKKCFAEFLAYEYTDRNVSDKLNNLLYCLQDLGSNCSRHVTKTRINKVCDIIELLNPMLEKKLSEDNFTHKTMTPYIIMKDYILNLIYSLPNTRVIDMLNEFVTLDTIDFKVKSSGIR